MYDLLLLPGIKGLWLFPTSYDIFTEIWIKFRFEEKVKRDPVQVFSIGITLADVLQNWLNWFHFLFLEAGLLISLIDYMIFLSPFLDVKRMSMSSHG